MRLMGNRAVNLETKLAFVLRRLRFFSNSSCFKIFRTNPLISTLGYSPWGFPFGSCYFFTKEITDFMRYEDSFLLDSIWDAKVEWVASRFLPQTDHLSGNLVGRGCFRTAQRAHDECGFKVRLWIAKPAGILGGLF